MEMYTENERGVLKISAQNIPEFKALIQQAEKEAQQLNHTMKKLSCFDFEVQFSVEEDQPCSTDSASSVMSTIPTK